LRENSSVSLWLRALGAFAGQLRRDGMLVLLLCAPVIALPLIGWGVPQLNWLLGKQWGLVDLLLPYYTLFDVLMVLLVPYLVGFAAVLAMLDEYDENITKHLLISPLGYKGYLITRLLLPALLAMVASLVGLNCFALSAWSFVDMVILSFMAALLCLPVNMVVFILAHNKVEGLVLAKVAGLMLLGLPLPFFANDYWFLLAAPLPSLWLGYYAHQPGLGPLLLMLLTSVFWMMLLYRRFRLKFI
jgi:fluoroquinolone transport system permease protein